LALSLLVDEFFFCIPIVMKVLWLYSNRYNLVFELPVHGCGYTQVINHGLQK
jgi:hypothetical protein